MDGQKPFETSGSDHMPLFTEKASDCSTGQTWPYIAYTVHNVCFVRVAVSKNLSISTGEQSNPSRRLEMIDLASGTVVCAIESP